MAYTFIEDFKAGMDRRRPISALQAGTLYTLENAHLTRAGDIEKRKKFVEKFTLPDGQAFGIHSLLGNLYTFGSAAGVVVAGMIYQRLQSPTGATMVALLDADNFDGKIYAIAEYDDGGIHHFYDGALVEDFEAGRVTALQSNNSGIAAHLTALIAQDDSYTASSLGNVITIEKAENGGFDITAITENVTGGVDDQSITLSRQRVGVDEVLAVGGFQILGGSSSPGVNVIGAVTVNGVNVIGLGIDWASSNAVTAQIVADAINNNLSVPEYRALTNGDAVIIQAAEGSGASPNGLVVQVTTFGDVIHNSGGFTVTGGTASAGVNKINSVKIGGVEVLGSAVDWITSNDVTAANIASTIRAFSGTYSAFASGARVLLCRRVSNGNLPINEITTAIVAGDVTVGDLASVNTTVANMQGGITGTKEKWTATIGGTFEVGDKFNINLDGKNFGYVGNPTLKGTQVLTHKSKIYSAAGSLLEFSGVNTPTGWNSDNDTGAGFVNMSNNDGGSQEIIGMEVYQGSLAIFGRRSVIIEFVDPDPALNRVTQTIKRTGLRATKAVIATSESDVIYLSDSGIRSLQARDSSNSAAMQDLGTVIDPLIRSTVESLDPTVVDAACAAIEPIDGRFMLALGDTIFVFTRFVASSISAWSYYKPGFTVEQFAELDDKLYCLADNKVYLYGGDTGTEYDDAGDCVVTAQLPFLHGNKPATYKELVAFDLDCENTWAVELLVDPRDLGQIARVGSFPHISYNEPASRVTVHATHIAPKLVCSGGGYARVSNLSLHYIGADTKAS